MEKSSAIGIGAGLGLITLSILVEGGLGSFVSVSSMIIVLGGVLSACLVNYPMEDLLNAQRAIQKAFAGQKIDMIRHIEMFTIFSRRARRNGLLVLDEDIRYIEDPYLKSGMELAVDGISEDNLVKILNDEIDAVEKRHDLNYRILNSMATYSPAFGMIGTLIGLILMLRNLSDSGGIGQGLSVALITTFYGTIFANLIFAPLGGKLKEYSEKELNEKKMLRSGIIALANGENPRILEKKMLSYCSADEKSEYNRIFGTASINQQQEDKMYNHWINQQKEKWESTLTDLQAG
ncbi:motility protein A [bacterium]|nr:MAG: motility protein A [bacterium]